MYFIISVNAIPL